MPNVVHGKDVVDDWTMALVLVLALVSDHTHVQATHPSALVALRRA